DVRYDQRAADPRIGHRLVLAIDDFGNVLESAALAYGRSIDPRVPSQFRTPQTATLATYTVATYTNAVDTDLDWRAPDPAESRTYQITGMSSSGAYFTGDEVTTQFVAAQRLDFADAATVGLQRRRVAHERTLYRADDLSGPLPLGQLHSRALPFESYKLA